MALEIKKVLYSISLDDSLSRAAITPVIIAESDERATLIASLEVDRMELLPSARLSIEEGLSVHTLRPVAIHRPLLWWPRPCGGQHLYTMSLRIILNAKISVADIRRIGIRDVRLEAAPAASSPTVSLGVNNRTLDAFRLAVPPAVHGAELRQALEVAVAQADQAMPLIAEIDDIREGDDQALDWSDENGVMIWCGGQGRSAAPDRKSFDFLLDESGALARCRNNPSLVLW